MDYMLDNVDEDRERIQRRKERMEKMRQEKQKQMERRQRMKKVIPAVVCGLLVLCLGVAGMVILGERKPKTSEVAVKEETQDIDETAMSPQVMQAEEVAQDNTVVTSENSGDIQAEILLNEEQEERVIYNFEPTAETIAIYNEEVISSNAILIDESTDTIVASKGAKERISPASMTKVLTILVAAENITEEQLDDTFIMTREITDYGYVNDCSAVGFLAEEKVTIRDMFYGTILPSGSDAAVGLATYVAGSHEAFVEMMNEKLEELGLAETSHYTNCVGLYDKEHYSTVYDMAVIMKAAIQNELCKTVLAEHNYTTESTTEHPDGINISNWFLRRIEDKETGGEVLCAKTGYVQQSKSCAVSYGIFANGTPYICVTAGSSSSWRCIYDHVEIYNQYVLS